MYIILYTNPLKSIIWNILLIFGDIKNVSNESETISRRIYFGCAVFFSTISGGMKKI